MSRTSVYIADEEQSDTEPLRRVATPKKELDALRLNKAISNAIAGM